MSSITNYGKLFEKLKNIYKYNIVDNYLYSKTWCDGGIIYEADGKNQIVHKGKPVNAKTLYNKIIRMVALDNITLEQKDGLFLKHVQLIRIVDEYGYPGTKVYLLKYQIDIIAILSELQYLNLLNKSNI